MAVTKNKKHNDPLTPTDAQLAEIRARYRLAQSAEAREKYGCLLQHCDKVWSVKTKKFVGTKQNGCRVHDGYPRLHVAFSDGQTRFFKLHHVTFFLFHGRWPKEQLDHKNHVKTDVRPANLEEVHDAENQKRRGLHLKNRIRQWKEDKEAMAIHEWPEEKTG